MPDRNRIHEAMDVVGRRFPPTPLIRSEQLSRQTGAEVFLKLENLQRTGSFKVRGAVYKLWRIRNEVGPRGVVAASAGNHAQGVALAASDLGIPATVIMPEGSSISKQVATRDYGARVLLHGKTVAEALDRARELEQEGYTFLHPFDDDDVIAGQATVGLELTEQLERFDEVWVPVGGGGLAAGVALALAKRRPTARVVGIQTRACPSALEALRQGHPVEVETERTLADGIRVPRIGERPFRVLRQVMEEVLLVEESRIAMAVVALLERKKLLAEGAGAVPVAALLEAPADRVRNRRIVLVVSGGNLDLNVLDRILEQGLMRTGRILRFRVILDDAPGALHGLLSIVSKEEGNILHIFHDRLSVDLPLGRTRVEVEVETRGFDHIGRLTAALLQGGYRIEASPVSAL
ncbi:threonine ammonia-lyase [Deferrisoma camini]|uniref:threonine ammonia-lyase n=1 Tax=Deferrisoma camini TaxID=1035120 RepID=UPI00046CF9A2|nr:threonine ammonia-lyase [Deferrisoma camini]